MKTIEDFFEGIEEFHDELESRSSKTIHTDAYENRIREMYADWQQVKISLKPLIDEEILDEIDDQVSILFNESRKANSSVSKSANYLREIEDHYFEYIYPEVSHREIEAGFVNSLVTELEGIEEDKYHGYMEEAIQCVQSGAYRGAVVLAWQAGMYGLYQRLERYEEPIHVAYQKKFNTKPDVHINDFWDFQKLKDEDILILAEEIGIVDKSLKDILTREKDIRNKAAHPGIYDVGPNGTKALLEAVLQLLVELELKEGNSESSQSEYSHPSMD